MKKGILVIISGPSGVGKGTVAKALLEGSEGQMVFSVSATTRKPRPGEEHGREYFFISDEEFEQMILDGEFLEYMHVFGRNFYGTPKSYVELIDCHLIFLRIFVSFCFRYFFSAWITCFRKIYSSKVGVQGLYSICIFRFSS